MAAAFQAPVDIGNRALQRVGSPRMIAFTDNTKEASEVSFCYDKLRVAELARNAWVFATRVTAVRPLTPDMRFLTFAGWLTGTTYAQNDLVVSQVDGQIYYSKLPTNVGNEPSANPLWWTLYFGPDVATQFITSWIFNIAYAVGDQTIGSNGVGYVSLAAANVGNNPTTDGGVHWAVDPTIVSIQFNSTENAYTAGNAYGQATSFYAGELTRVGGVVYLSLINSNTDIPIASGITSWLALTAQPAQSIINFIYPIGAGPWTDASTKNVYRLPVNFLRIAPQDPKAGQAQYLGGPDGAAFDDWNFQDNYFTSWGTGVGSSGSGTPTGGVIALRFIANIQDVTLMAAMFCEGLACRIGEEVCETLTQSTEKITLCQQLYKQFMGDARTLNFIEEGPVYQPEDSYVTCRW